MGGLAGRPFRSAVESFLQDRIESGNRAMKNAQRIHLKGGEMLFRFWDKHLCLSYFLSIAYLI